RHQAARVERPAAHREPRPAPWASRRSADTWRMERSFDPRVNLELGRDDRARGPPRRCPLSSRTPTAVGEPQRCAHAPAARGRAPRARGRAVRARDESGAPALPRRVVADASLQLPSAVFGVSEEPEAISTSYAALKALKNVSKQP